jgi:hypothetical protein
MLANFTFSISVALPIFLIMLSGFILKEKGIITASFTKTANFIVFYIALPVKLFNSVSQSSVRNNFDLKFILFTIAGTCLSVILVTIFSLLFVKDKSKTGSFIHGAFRGNFVYIGFSLLENVMGSIPVKASLIVAFVVPVYNILGVLILILSNVERNSEQNKIKHALKNIITNPFIVAIFFGIIASLLKIKLPVLIQNTCSYFDLMATPLALLAIGATFQLDKLFVDILPAVLATILKLFILPTLAVLAGSFLAFSADELFLVYILFGVPSAISSYIISSAMGGDENLAASIVMMTTLFSVISLTLFVFVFKSFALV